MKPIRREPPPTKTEGEPQKVTDVLKDIYKAFDVVLERATETMPVTCKKGCAHCCELLTMMSLPEGLLIAEHLLEQDNWKEWVPRLREACLANDFTGLNKATFFAKRNKCVFLTEDKLCSIYEQRPACCRLHLVMNDPAICEPIPENMGKQTEALNFLELEGHVWGFAKVVEDQLQTGSVMGVQFAPIPIMTLWCMAKVASDEPEALNYIRKALTGIPTPDQWMGRHHRAFMDEGDGVDAVAAEQIIQISKKVFGK